jgi:hypothetical protein
MSVLSKIRALCAGNYCQHRYTRLLLPLLLLVLLLGGSLSAQAQTDRTVSGTITLQGLDAYASAQPIRFKFFATDSSGTVVRDINIGPSGTFSAANLPRKNFTLSMKGPKWLRKNVLNVNTTNGDVTGVTATLKAADGNNDNSVDVFDLDLLIQSFNLESTDPGFIAGADFTCDDWVDIFDLDLLIQNFNLEGDTDPSPPLLNFTLTATQQGGLPIVGTVTFSEPITSSMTLSITAAPNGAVAVPGSSSNTVTCYDDSTVEYQNTFYLNTSTVNYSTLVTVFATYEQTTLKATTTLTPINFRVVWLRPDGSNVRVRLEWNTVSTSNNLRLLPSLHSPAVRLPTRMSSTTSPSPLPTPTASTNLSKICPAPPTTSGWRPRR